MNWEFGKPPELVVEVVSNDQGAEEGKFADYARAGVYCYAIFDPRLYFSKRPLRVYTLHAGRYVEVLDPAKLDALKLGLALWNGTFEGMAATWLRCYDQEGNLLLTGRERAEQERELEGVGFRATSSNGLAALRADGGGLARVNAHEIALSS